MIRSITILIFLHLSLESVCQQVFIVLNAKHFSDKMDSLVAGDTIMLSESGDWKDQDIVFSPSKSGEPNNPIVLTCEPGVVLTGSSSLKLFGNYLVVDGLKFIGKETETERIKDKAVIEFGLDKEDSSTYSRNCRITNISIIDYNQKDEHKKRFYHWVRILGKNHEVDHCLFQNKFGSGSTVQINRKYASNEIPDFHNVHHNYFKRRKAFNKKSTQEAIQIGNARRRQDAPESVQAVFGNSQSTIEYNLFFDQDGEDEIISVKSDSNIIRHNTFRRCGGSLTLRNGYGNTVYGNFFFGENENNTGGISIMGSGHSIINNYIQDMTKGGIHIKSGCDSIAPCYGGKVNRPPVRNVVISYNTIVNSKNSIIIGSTFLSSSIPPNESVELSNNTIWNFADENVHLIKIEQNGNPTFLDNLIYKNSENQRFGFDNIPSGITIDVNPNIGINQLMFNYFNELISEEVLPNLTKKPLTEPDVGPL